MIEFVPTDREYTEDERRAVKILLDWQNMVWWLRHGDIQPGEDAPCYNEDKEDR